MSSSHAANSVLVGLQPRSKAGLGLRYAKGPDGTRGFAAGRGRPLPEGLPPPASSPALLPAADGPLPNGLPPPRSTPA